MKTMLNALLDKWCRIDSTLSELGFVGCLGLVG
jgi:hypothetical protein